MATGVAGEEITPIVNADFDLLSLTPTVPAATSSQVVVFNAGYSIYVDNQDNGGGSGTRWWLDTPNNADVVIGPRAGGAIAAGIRFRTSRTTASAANMFISSTTYEIARSTSSLKYKRDVEDADLDLDAVRQLRPVTYRDRNEVHARATWEARRAAAGDNARILELLAEQEPPEPRTYVGLIAEEVHELGLRGFVQYDESTGEPDGLMYDRMVVGLLGLMQEQAAKLEGIEQRLAALEGKG